MSRPAGTDSRSELGLPPVGHLDLGRLITTSFGVSTAASSVDPV